MASDDNKSEKGSLAEIEKELNDVKKREMELSDELKKLIKSVDTDLVSFAKAIDRFHEDVEKAISSINSDNEMGVKELVAKTPENIVHLVKSVKDVKSKMQSDMIKSLSKLLHFIHVDSEEICTNKLPDKCQLQIDSFCPHDKNTREVVDVWIEMLQDDNKRLRERNKLYREHAALVNRREQLVSEERDRIRKELNVLYQKVGSHVDSGDKLVCVNDHFNGNVKDVYGTNHKETSTDDLYSDGSDEEDGHDTNDKETSTDDLSFDGSGEEGVHVKEHEKTRTDELSSNGRGKEDVHGTQHKETSTDDMIFTGHSEKGVYGTNHKETSTDDLSSYSSCKEDVHGTDDKETSTDDLSFAGSVKEDALDKQYTETNIDDVMKAGSIQGMQKLLNVAQQQIDELNKALQQTNQSLQKKNDLLKLVHWKTCFEVDVVNARKSTLQEGYLLDLLTKKNIECKLVENFTISDDFNRVALILCLATSKKEWDKVLETSKRIFPENRPVAIAMMYCTSNESGKQNCEEAQKKHVEFLSNAKVFSIRYYFNKNKTPSFGIFNNEENKIVEFIHENSIERIKVVPCLTCAKKQY